ncbi:hypothetical protein [Candidatus Pelagibacter communis]|jgi:hypothetical protein|uniref:capsular polysaccharide export protein, LipB/KpsS family n=1 Tax=Pelagibacter ubique TaxID=198252 RepID=UPI00036DFB34|nr:hypothetical protein [Candidatus Pelagibacter ubique]
MKVLIHISSQQKLFFISLIDKFSRKGFEVDLLVRDKFILRFLKPYLKKRKVNNIFIEDTSSDIFDPNVKNANQIIKKAINFEYKYKQNISFVMSKDRALGRGYLVNVDKYVEIERANWKQTKKLKYFFHIFDDVEKIILKSNPKAIVSVSRSTNISIIAEKKNIKYLTMASARIGARYYWSDNSFNTNQDIISKVKKKFNSNIDSKIKFEKIKESVDAHARIKYDLSSTLKSVFLQLIRELKLTILGSRKKFSYVFMGWAKFSINRYFMYKFVTKKSTKFIEIKKKKFIYVPLHLEPEIALIGLSPEFTNSIEMITWLSKSVPADFLIVVKEQPYAYGSRSSWYYKSLMQMPNVVLAEPKINPWLLIKKCFCVATITGSTAIEAVNMNKPVLSYGVHQIVNYLPTVKYCSNYFSTKKNIDYLVNNKINKKKFQYSKNILINSIYKSSFEVVEYSQSYDDLSTVNSGEKYIKNIDNSSKTAFAILCKILNV